MKVEWTNVKEKLPPDNDTPVLYWNVLLGVPYTTTSSVLRSQLIQIQKGYLTKETLLSKDGIACAVLKTSGYFASHWANFNFPEEAELREKNMDYVFHYAKNDNITDMAFPKKGVRTKWPEQKRKSKRTKFPPKKSQSNLKLL